MTDITTYPLEDWFETTLSQDWDGEVGTIYVNTTPSFTFPAGVTTYIIVDPGKSNMQLAEISAYSSSLNTITVSSISTNKGANVAYTQQAHRIGAVVRISHNYQFWKDIVDSLNSKIDTNNDDIAMGKFADTTARDAYFTAPVEGNSAYITGVGRYDYTSWSWVLRAANTWAASVLLTGNQTVWGVKTFDDWLVADWLTSNNDVEVRWQDILHTGRYAWLTNRVLVRLVETKNNANNWGVRFAEYVDADNALVWNRRYAIWWYPIKTDGSWYWTSKEMFYLDFPTYDGNVTFTTSGKFMVDNLYLNDQNIYWAASDAEWATGTATNRVPTVLQLNRRAILQTTRAINTATGTQNVSHWLWVTPKYVQIIAKHALPSGSSVGYAYAIIGSEGRSNFSTNMCSYSGFEWGDWTHRNVLYWNQWSAAIYVRNSDSAVSGRHQTQSATITADWTNIILNWTYSSNSSTLSNNIVLTIMCWA